jgi:hypothetical protein
MENIWGSCKKIFEYDYSFGAPNSSSAVEGEKESQRSWQYTVASIGAIGMWLFKSFRAAYITCFPSCCSKSEQAKRKLQEMRASWFPSEIPLSSRMEDREFIIECFDRHSQFNSIVKDFFVRQREKQPENLTVKSFFENHVFTLPFTKTVCVLNPEPYQAFWRDKQTLETDLEILIRYLAEAQIERKGETLPEGEEAREAKIKKAEETVLGEFFREKGTPDGDLFAACVKDFAEDPGKFLSALDTYFEKYFQEEE